MRPRHLPVDDIQRRRGSAWAKESQTGKMLRRPNVDHQFLHPQYATEAGCRATAPAYRPRGYSHRPAARRSARTSGPFQDDVIIYNTAITKAVVCVSTTSGTGSTPARRCQSRALCDEQMGTKQGLYHRCRFTTYGSDHAASGWSVSFKGKRRRDRGDRSSSRWMSPTLSPPTIKTRPAGQA